MRAGSPRNRRPAGVQVRRDMSPTVERNRLAAGAALLGEIEDWCERTGTYEGRIGQILFGAGGYVPLLRRRLTVHPATEQMVRSFINAFPRGIEGREATIRVWVAGRVRA
jgi:hypothetical protein